MTRPRPPGRGTAAAALLAALLLAAGCTSGTADTSGSSASSAPAGSPGSGTAGVRVAGTVAEGLDTPWGLVRLPDGDLLVGSRDTGRVLRVAAAGGAGGGGGTEVGTVPGTTAGGEGGLLGLALSPDGRLFAYQTAAEDNRVLRFDWDPTRPAGEQLGPPTVVLSGIPKAGFHDGGRIAFGPDGLLYVGTGDAGRSAQAQDRTALGGKILRITPDGAPAPGNPFPGSPVYSLGHRNVQGLAWDPAGHLWASEFGQNTWDELNLIKPGANYGWPVVEGRAGRGGCSDPVAQWSPADASPSGIAYADGSIWLAALRGTRLWQVPLDGERAASAPTPYLRTTYGRLRTVLAEPDGTLLLTTSNTDGRGTPRPGDDHILRITLH
ncbi:PQQ-dependent sugar dehydrogenase [Kitasatospora camelliae]|uniref:PQQ-dependent sugar dehydrogenase n=1 Tax=Kitasatospora camelliae TaxID=3156397 RepID=A0AAU8K2S1_9ACTN